MDKINTFCEQFGPDLCQNQVMLSMKYGELHCFIGTENFWRYMGDNNSMKCIPFA
jgi:hypothetical protein